MPTLEEIPDEIIHHILSFVSPENNLLRVQLLSRRLNTIANEPLLWRQHCRTAFTYWGPDHDFQAKLDGKVSDVDWKALFLFWPALAANPGAATALLSSNGFVGAARVGSAGSACLSENGSGFLSTPRPRPLRK
ncbi:hypothetical protein BN1723_007210 [Verticillium longisporum]|uniref:F-box domain-containing protein n=1 Tax=Verticillium longisporum TaxID=100787 RepID=A0A0G4NJX9_VERLO|nr:hypothetical protein BN1723_007210 [Verticillium longisporum]